MEKEDMTEYQQIEQKKLDTILEKLGGNNMDGVGNGYAWNRIYDQAAYGGRSYENVGTNVGNGFLGFQNMRINDNVEHGFCDANLDRATKFTNGVILDNQTKMQADNKIDSQSAFLTSQYADLKSTINNDNLIIKNDITALAGKLADCCCDQKVAAAEAKGRDDLMNYKLDTMLNAQNTNTQIRAMMASNFNLGSCQPENTPCGN